MPGSSGRSRRAKWATAIVGVSVLGATFVGVVPAGAGSQVARTAKQPATTTFVPVSGFTVAKPPTAAQVNTAVADGVDYLDCQQDQTAGADFGSFGGDVPETAAAIIGYGVLDKGNIANLPTALDNPACPGATRNLQTDLTDGLTWLLGQQDTTDPVQGGSAGGSWTFESTYYTYSTGLALTALGLNTDVPALNTQIKAAIALGRGFLATPGEFENEPPPGETGGPAECTTTPDDYVSNSGTQDTSYYCGGWNYGPEYLLGGPRSDESNTGYALTGLHVTGGLTPDEAALDLGWQTNDQADTTTNAYWSGTHDDGGGSYQPPIVTDTGDDFSSNANDSGSLLFGLADDGVPISSPQVQAAIQFDTDALDTYEKQANTDTGGPGYETGPHVMVYHDGASEDGSCAPGTAGCDWYDGSGEGGFHYSLFTIAKGLGSYLPADLSDGTNWYAKIADLLVSQQDTTSVCIPAQDTPCNFGSWPADLRDDFSTIFATGLSIVALGLVATPPPPLQKVTSVAASPVCDDVSLGWTNPTTPNYGGVFIQRSTTGFPATASDGTRAANVAAPGTKFTDKHLVPGTKYYYALFAHDTTGQAVAGGADIAVTPTCTAPPALSKVTEIVASAACSTVVLTWTNPTSTHYGGAYIQRSTSGFPSTSADGTRVAALAASKTSFTDEHLLAGTKYYYALFAHDTTGLAVAKGVDIAATPTCRPPGSLSNVRAIVASATCSTVVLSWTNPTSTHYGGAYIQRATNEFPATSFEGTRVADVGASQTTFTDQHLLPGTTYYYALFGHDTTGLAVAGGTDIAATPRCEPPSSVSDVTVIVASAACSTVVLSWTNPTSSDYGGAYIQRATSGFPATFHVGTRVADVGASRTTFTDEGLVPGTRYYYAVFAHDPTGLAVAGGVDVAATPRCEPPSALRNVAAIVASAACSSVVLTWTNPAASHYGGAYIERATNGFPATAAQGTRVADVGASRTTFTDENLIPDKTYYYALFAHDTTGLAIGPGEDIAATPTCTIEYRLEGGDGGVFDFHASFYGSVPDRHIKLYDFVGMASATHGYWLVTSTGRVFNFGGAQALGSLPGEGIDVDNIVGIAASGASGGYWLVSSTGTVYPFGDAPHFGSLASRGVHVNDVVAIASPGPGGFWVVTATGRVFGFGNASTRGSCDQTASGCSSLAAPIVAMATPNAGGYWLVDRDGAVFRFGDAALHGSCATALSGCFGATDVVGIATPDAGGYWIVTANGSVSAFGDARQYGGCPSANSDCQRLNRPIVAISPGQAAPVSVGAASSGVQLTRPSPKGRATRGSTFVTTWSWRLF